MLHTHLALVVVVVFVAADNILAFHLASPAVHLQRSRHITSFCRHKKMNEAYSSSRRGDSLSPPKRTKMEHHHHNKHNSKHNDDEPSSNKGTIYITVGPQCAGEFHNFFSPTCPGGILRVGASDIVNKILQNPAIMLNQVRRRY
jgi:hypothetical protein